MVDVQQALENLRDKIAAVIADLEVWDSLHDVKNALGLPDEDVPRNLGKHRYLRMVTAAASDQKVIHAAKRMIKSYPGTRGKLSSVNLQQIQDDLWWIESQGTQQITNVTRHRFADSLESLQFWGRLSLREFLTSVISGPQVNGNNLSDFLTKADGKIYKRSVNYKYDFFVFSNPFSHPQRAPAKILDPDELEPYKYSQVQAAMLFRELGFLEWPDQRFSLLIERIVHPEVQESVTQQKLVALSNRLLQHDGFELREETIQGGLPVYKVRKRAAGVSGAPKYIIFASTGLKPDIVIDDAVNMDIRVVHHADKCLVYDQPPPTGDLTWNMLVEWWSKHKGLKVIDDKTRRELGHRLRKSLPKGPERDFFNTYFRAFKPRLGDNLPALLPQVYLHYDPRNQSERKRPVLARQRMDFLILLRNESRVVIEIDGAQHYSDNGHALPQRYAEMVAEDRRIRLLGYEVYRFGGAEFVDFELARKTVITFFEDLFIRHKIPSI